MAAIYTFTRMFTTAAEAIADLMKVSWALEYSTLEYFKGCKSATEFQQAIASADEAGCWAEYGLETDEEGGFRFEFVTHSGANAVDLQVYNNGYAQATYSAWSKKPATESSIVERCLSHGWTPDPDLAADLEDARADAQEAKLLETVSPSVTQAPSRSPIRKPSI